MILQALVKYYENLAEQGKVSRLGWCHAKVSYEINLSSEGDIIGITSRKIEDMRGKKVVWVPTNLVVPEMVTRSSGVAANFLCDNSKYMLGIDADGTNSRVVDCFQATKEKHGQILQSAQGKTARAMLGGRKTVVCEFLGTGMISVMPVPLLSVHPRECSPQGHIRYVPSVCACRWTYPVPPHKPPLQAL